LSEFNNW